MSIIASVNFLNQPIASIDEHDLPIELDLPVSWTDGPRSLVLVDRVGRTTALGADLAYNSELRPKRIAT